MTPEEIDALPVYTDAQLLKVYRMALARGWAGTKQQIDGTSFEFPSSEKILDVCERLEERIANQTDATNGCPNPLGTALTTFN